MIVQVDLSKAEQFGPEFLKMNPKHEVPVFDHDGKFITESREIAKYFHEHFNIAPEDNDHWYPSDPEERQKVTPLMVTQPQLTFIMILMWKDKKS